MDTFKAVLKNLGTVGSVCGVLMLANALFAPSATAQTANDLNESDRTARLRALQLSVINRETSPDSLSQPSSMSGQNAPVDSVDSGYPLPEDRSVAIATAVPVDNQLSIMLVNDTGAVVTYEVVGDTTRRELMGGESAMLQSIPLPATITAIREDEGLLDVTANASEAGMLEISLMQAPALDDTQGVVRIQEDGQVFVN
ncbi:MAG: hypothetical protein WA885_11490 [Phormidesmis sp.]